MKITYGVIKEIYCIGEETRTSYGIAAYSYANEEKTSIILASIHDITSDKNKLLKLVQDCNESELSLIHINDIVDDFLAD